MFSIFNDDEIFFSILNHDEMPKHSGICGELKIVNVPSDKI